MPHTIVSNLKYSFCSHALAHFSAPPQAFTSQGNIVTQPGQYHQTQQQQTPIYSTQMSQGSYGSHQVSTDSSHHIELKCYLIQRTSLLMIHCRFGFISI